MLSLTDLNEFDHISSTTEFICWAIGEDSLTKLPLDYTLRQVMITQEHIHLPWCISEWDLSPLLQPATN